METLSFEEAFAQLEEAVVALQDGKLPLDSAMQYYQKGMKLAQHCNTLLQQAELSVQQLTVADNGDLEVHPLDIDGER